jgi:hypothetical protein
MIDEERDILDLLCQCASAQTAMQQVKWSLAEDVSDTYPQLKRLSQIMLKQKGGESTMKHTVTHTEPKRRGRPRKVQATLTPQTTARQVVDAISAKPRRVKETVTVKTLGKSERFTRLKGISTAPEDVMLRVLALEERVTTLEKHK